MRRWLPWIVAAIFAVAFVVVLIAKRGTSNEINGVTQGDSGRRVTAWIDPMYSQGPPHIYKSNHPGRAPDCGMKLVPVYADATTTTAPSSTVAGYANVAVSGQRQQIIGVKLATAELRSLSRTIRTTGRVAVDERRTAQVRTKFEGFVETLYVNFTGQPVRRGDPLLAVYSPDLLATQNELILAERNHSDLGRTLAASALLQKQDELLRQVPEVERVFGKAGRADTSTDPAPLSMMETTVVLKPESQWRAKPRWYSSWMPSFLMPLVRPLWPDRMSWEELTNDLNQRLQLPGQTNAWTMPIRNRIDMLTTGIRTPVGIKVFGADLKQIENVGKQLDEQIVSRVPGARSVYGERVSGGYFVDFDIDRDHRRARALSDQHPLSA